MKYATFGSVKKPLYVPNVTCEGLFVNVDQWILLRKKRLDIFINYIILVRNVLNASYIFKSTILVIFNNITRHQFYMKN